MRTLLVSALAVAALGAFPPERAEARFAAPGLQAPSMVERAQCTTRVIRDRRPNGTVVVRRVQNCAPRVGPPVVRIAPPVVGFGQNCRTVTTRVREGNRTVVRTRRVC